MTEKKTMLPNIIHIPKGFEVHVAQVLQKKEAIECTSARLAPTTWEREVCHTRGSVVRPDLLCDYAG